MGLEAVDSGGSYSFDITFETPAARADGSVVRHSSLERKVQSSMPFVTTARFVYTLNSCKISSCARYALFVRPVFKRKKKLLTDHTLLA